MKKYITIICASALLVACRVEKEPSTVTNEKIIFNPCAACHAKNQAAVAECDAFDLLGHIALLRQFRDNNHERAENYAAQILQGIVNDAQIKLDQKRYPKEAGIRIEEYMEKAKKLLSEEKYDGVKRSLNFGKYQDTYDEDPIKTIDWSK